MCFLVVTCKKKRFKIELIIFMPFFIIIVIILDEEEDEEERLRSLNKKLIFILTEIFRKIKEHCVFFSKTVRA